MPRRPRKSRRTRHRMCRVVGDRAPISPRGNANGLSRVAASVGIVAGVVLVAAMIFFSGWTLGRWAANTPDRDDAAPRHDGLGRNDGTWSDATQRLCRRFGGTSGRAATTTGPAMTGPGGMMGPGRKMGPGQTPPSAFVAVSVATVWTTPQSPRPVDHPALTNPVEFAAGCRI